MSGVDFTPEDLFELKLLFLRELTEGYRVARSAHERLGKDPGDAGAVEELGGFFHRIAGTAHTVNLSLLAYTASITERIADRVKDGTFSSAEHTQELFADALAAVATVLDDHGTGITERPLLYPRRNELEDMAIADTLAEGRELSKVLVIDDDQISAHMIDSCLRAAGFMCSFCCDPQEALKAIEMELPDLIILDVIMPEIDGFELCRRVREHPALQFTPIIFVTRKGEVAERIRGLDAGGNDYIAKPFEPHELVARVRSHLSRLASLREMAVRDGLTRCFNHKYFRLRLAQEVTRAARYDHHLTLAMVDVDKFKDVNDTYGHRAGDMVLSHLASIVVSAVRTTDAVARYGGEEFAVLMVHTSVEDAQVVCNRLRERIAVHDFRYTTEEEEEGVAVPVTVSVGIAGLVAKKDTLESLLKRADQALYLAKSRGRNQVVVADPD